MGMGVEPWLSQRVGDATKKTLCNMNVSLLLLCSLGLLMGEASARGSWGYYFQTFHPVNQEPSDNKVISREQLYASEKRKPWWSLYYVKGVNGWPWISAEIPPADEYYCLFLFYACTDFQTPKWPGNKAKCEKLFKYCSAYIQNPSGKFPIQKILKSTTTVTTTPGPSFGTIDFSGGNGTILSSIFG